MKRSTLYITFLLIISVLLSSCTPAAIKNNEQIPIQKETEHFIFKSNDTEYIEEISSFMENRYGQFDENFDIQNEDKMKITIYPDKNELLSVVPDKASNGYIYGDETNDIMITIPDDAQTYQALLHNMYYISILITLDKFNSHIPDYIKYGVAGYEALPGQKSAEIITEAANNSSVPTLNELKSVKEDDIDSVYDYSYALIDYIIESYGYDKLNKLLENPDIKQTFNMSEDKFYANWTEYLKEMYPSLDKSKETEHFVIKYAEADENAADDVLNTLEDSYERLTSDLQTELQTKCTVNLYPTNSSLQKSINILYSGQRHTIDAVGFTVSKDSFSLTSPNDFKHAESSYDEILSSAVHEFVHILTLNLSDKLPTYLNEGVACYESEKSDDTFLTIRYAMNSMKGYALPLDMQELAYMTVEDQYGAVYEYGYTVVEYVVKQYGYDALVKLIKTNGDILLSTGIDENEFYQGWIKHLKENY